ncbi:lipocalin family protein, partial [Pseudoalteromonas sp. SIMBA_153]
TWYEIGRLPMYFQRKCAGDVTANYAQKDDGSGITVTNKCIAEDGSGIVAEVEHGDQTNKDNQRNQKPNF